MRDEEIQRILRGRNPDVIDREFAYAEWVKSLAPWDTFGTGTFPPTSVRRGGFDFLQGHSEPAVCRCFERWIKKEVPGVHYFFGIDPNPGRDGHHVHYLLALGDRKRRTELFDSWFERYSVERDGKKVGARNSVLPIESIGGVSGYCAKYPLTGARWWDIGNFIQEPKSKPLGYLFTNAPALLQARREAADRLIARWGSVSRPERYQPPCV